MKSLLLFILVLLSISSLQAQRKFVKNEWFSGPLIGFDYNIYHQYTKPSDHPFSSISTKSNSAQQILNVLPGIRMGFLFGVTHTYNERGLNWHENYHFSIEAAFNYIPFSQNFDEYKGVGGISIPITINSHFPVGNLKIAVALGVQFSKTEMNIRPVDYQGIDNPFYMTYVAEIGLGQYDTDYSFMLGYHFFSRFGFHPNRAMTIDIGVKGSIAAGSPY
jgi:hypothetical protein